MRSILYKISIIVFCCLSCLILSAAKIKSNSSQINITIQGLSGSALKNATAVLKLKKELISSTQTNAVRRHFFNEIPDDVKTAIQPFGYFKAHVKASVKEINGHWNIFVKVNPGQRLKFTKVNVIVIGEGLTNRHFQFYLNSLPIKPGDYFNSEKYELIKTTLQNIANSYGFFDAMLRENKLSINLKNYTSSVNIKFDTGARFHFGQTYFSTSPIKDSLLERYLLYSPGQYYKNKLLEQSRINLSNSPYFQQVNMTPLLKEAKNHNLPIGVELFPQDQVLYSFGAGYGTDTGFRGLISMDLRYLNAAGHSMKVYLRGSQLNNQLAAQYNIPGPNPTRDLISITGGVLTMNQVTGTGKSAQLGASYQTSILGIKFLLSLNYLTERYSLNNYPVEGINTRTNTSLLYPTINLQKKIAKDNSINPSRGLTINFTASAANENIGSKTSFSQYRLDTSFLFTINLTHTRVVSRFSFGATAIENLMNLPLSMQFFTGGPTTIRGYVYNSIGPGRYLAVGSFELQQRIIGNFYLAGFIDAGNVSNNIFHQKPFIGSGPALVYLSPIGPIELSIAKAVSPYNGNWHVQFSMGVLL